MPLYALGDAEPVLPPDGRFWIAPNAQLMGRIVLKEDVSIWWGAILRGDNDPITVGERSNVQDGSVLHTDEGTPLTIGEDVTIGHMVMLHGCSIGDGSLIGIGSIVLNGARIGKGCLVGANTLITEGKEFPDNSMIVGSPGRVLKTLTPEQGAMIAPTGQLTTSSNWKRYARELKVVG